MSVLALFLMILLCSCSADEPRGRDNWHCDDRVDYTNFDKDIRREFVIPVYSSDDKKLTVFKLIPTPKSKQ